jgi:ArsR family transcriptional regulator
MAEKNLSNEALEMIAARFKVLGEPLRLRILHKLQDGEKSVNELVDQVAASQPNVSKHLKILLEAGVVRRQQNGNAVYYSIADASIFRLCDLVCNSLEERLKDHARILAVS